MKQDRIKLIEEMLGKNPEDTFLNYAAALEYRKYGQTDKAKKLFEKIKTNDPKYLPVYYQLGKLYEEGNNTKKAVEIYKKGIAVAKEQEDNKTMGELSEALLILDEDFEGSF